MLQFYLFLFSPAFAGHYDPAQLDAKDQARAEAHPALHKRLQWQVSRAAKHYLAEHFAGWQLCMSHKADYCLIAAEKSRKPGADIELIKPRDYAALAKEICDAREQQALENAANPQLLFYQMWTAKEALIKAEDLRFPADMRAAGIDKSLKNRQYQRFSAVINGELLATVLFSPQAENCKIISDIPVTLTHTAGSFSTALLP